MLFRSCESAADPTETGPCGEGRALVDLNAALDADHGYDGDLSDAVGSLVGTCGGAAGGEDVFAWRSEGLVDRVTFSTRHARTHAPTVLYVRATCDALADLGCDRGGADPGAEVTLDHPQPGLYYVVVDRGSPDVVGPYRLTVDEVRAPACRNGEDDDADGLTDLLDPGCTGPEDADETDPPARAACSNGADDDGDGFTDYPADPDCVAAGGEREAPLCALADPVVPVGQAGGQFALAPQGGNGHAGGSCDVGFGAETVLEIGRAHV